MPVKIDLDKCTGCGDCVEACGMEVLAVEDDKAKIVNGEECTECGICVDECSAEAITMEE